MNVGILLLSLLLLSFSIFRDSTTALALRNDLHKLTHYLNQNYPTDTMIQQWTETFNSEYVPRLDITGNQQQSGHYAGNQQQRKKNKTTNKKETIRNKLLSGLTHERFLTGNMDLDFSNESTCLQNLTDLKRLENSSNAHIILISSQQGECLKYLKSIIPKQQTISSFLQEKNILISPQKCRSLIILYELVLQFPTITHTNLPVSFFTQNCKIIKEICKELKW